MKGVIDIKGVHVLAFFALIVVTLLGLTLLGAFVALLLSFAGITDWPKRQSLSVLLCFFSLGLTAFLAPVWVMACSGTIKFEPSERKFIGKSLIGALLAAVASASVAALQTP